MFPSTTEWIEALFGQQGAGRYLSDLVAPAPDGWLIAHDVNIENNQPFVVGLDHNITLRAIKVEHGRVPALAWRVEIAGKSISYRGDNNGNAPAFVDFVHNSDLFIAHNAVAKSSAGVERSLHMPASQIGSIAQQAQVKRLLISHRMRRTIGREQQTTKAIRQYYRGPYTFSKDLQCYPVF